MAAGRKFIQEGSIRRREDALDRTLARHQRAAEDPPQEAADRQDEAPESVGDNEQQQGEDADQFDNLLTNQQDSKFSNKLSNQQDSKQVRNEVSQQTSKRIKKTMDPLVRVVLDKLALPYPDADGGKEPTVLIAGRVPQEVSDRLDLIVQHLAKKPKQQVLADALKLYIAHMEQEGRRQ